MATIALCIPAYNAAWCLPRLLQSAKNQLVAFDEILVYNDASTDNTTEVAKKYGATVVVGKKNMGCSYGKNKLAEIATSEWIHFHDADDELLPNFTKIVHKWMNQNDGLDIVLLNFEFRDYNTGALLGILNYDHSKLLEDPKRFVVQNKIVNFALCKRTSFLNIGGFDLDTNVLYNEDRAFYIRAAASNLIFDYEPEVTSINYRYSDSMSASNELKCIEAYYHVSRKAVDELGENYYDQIAAGLWGNATMAAAHQDWKLLKQNILLATKLSGRIPISQTLFIKAIGAISPYFAFWLREKMIRIFKPQLRRNYN